MHFRQVIALLVVTALVADPASSAGCMKSAQLTGATISHVLYQAQAINPELVEGFDNRQNPPGRSIASSLRQAEYALLPMGTLTVAGSLTLPSTYRAARIYLHMGFRALLRWIFTDEDQRDVMEAELAQRWSVAPELLAQDPTYGLDYVNFETGLTNETWVRRSFAWKYELITKFRRGFVAAHGMMSHDVQKKRQGGAISTYTGGALAAVLMASGISLYWHLSLLPAALFTIVAVILPTLRPSTWFFHPFQRRSAYRAVMTALGPNGHYYNASVSLSDLDARKSHDADPVYDISVGVLTATGVMGVVGFVNALLNASGHMLGVTLLATAAGLLVSGLLHKLYDIVMPAEAALALQIPYWPSQIPGTVRPALERVLREAGVEGDVWFQTGNEPKRERGTDGRLMITLSQSVVQQEARLRKANTLKIEEDGPASLQLRVLIGKNLMPLPDPVRLFLHLHLFESGGKWVFEEMIRQAETLESDRPIIVWTENADPAGLPPHISEFQKLWDSISKEKINWRAYLNKEPMDAQARQLFVGFVKWYGSQTTSPEPTSAYHHEIDEGIARLRGMGRVVEVIDEQAPPESPLLRLRASIEEEIMEEKMRAMQPAAALERVRRAEAHMFENQAVRDQGPDGSSARIAHVVEDRPTAVHFVLRGASHGFGIGRELDRLGVKYRKIFSPGKGPHMEYVISGGAPDSSFLNAHAIQTLLHMTLFTPFQHIEAPDVVAEWAHVLAHSLPLAMLEEWYEQVLKLENSSFGELTLLTYEWIAHRRSLISEESDLFRRKLWRALVQGMHSRRSVPQRTSFESYYLPRAS